MKQLLFHSETGGIVAYQYCIGRLGDKHAIVIKQTSATETSIALQNEVIVNRILQTDRELLGLDPKGLRVFEFVPRSLGTLAEEWLETRYAAKGFCDVTSWRKIGETLGFLSKLPRLAWVDDPHLHRISEDTKAQLMAFDSELATA